MKYINLNAMKNPYDKKYISSLEIMLENIWMCACAFCDCINCDDCPFAWHNNKEELFCCQNKDSSLRLIKIDDYYTGGRFDKELKEYIRLIKEYSYKSKRIE